MPLAAALTSSIDEHFRPGTVDTGMQAWIRGRAPEQIGAGLHGRFTRARREGHLITPGWSSREWTRQRLVLAADARALLAVHCGCDLVGFLMSHGPG